MPRFSFLRLPSFGIIYLMASWRPLRGKERQLVMVTVSRKGYVTSSLFRPGHAPPRSKVWR